MSKCIHCSSRLVPNPIHTHWFHCPVCEPEFSKWATNYIDLMARASYAASAVADTRGAPHKVGSS